MRLYYISKPLLKLLSLKGWLQFLYLPEGGRITTVYTINKRESKENIYINKMFQFHSSGSPSVDFYHLS